MTAPPGIARRPQTAQASAGQHGPRLSEFRGRLFLTTSEAAQILDVDVRTVRRAVELGQIEGIRLSENVIRVRAIPFWELCGLSPESMPGDSEAGALTPATAQIELVEGAHDHHAQAPHPQSSTVRVLHG